MSFNKIILVGNLGRDPELRYTAQGTPVCSFSMATNERRKDRNGEMQDHTTWFRITLWNRLAETASQYLQKGKQVYIEGRLRVEEYIDRDGKPFEITRNEVRQVHVISGKAEKGKWALIGAGIGGGEAVAAERRIAVSSLWEHQRRDVVVAQVCFARASAA